MLRRFPDVLRATALGCVAFLLLALPAPTLAAPAATRVADFDSLVGGQGGDEAARIVTYLEKRGVRLHVEGGFLPVLAGFEPGYATSSSPRNCLLFVSDGSTVAGPGVVTLTFDRPLDRIAWVRSTVDGLYGLPPHWTAAVRINSGLVPGVGGENICPGLDCVDVWSNATFSVDGPDIQALVFTADSLGGELLPFALDDLMLWGGVDTNSPTVQILEPTDGSVFGAESSVIVDMALGSQAQPGAPVRMFDGPTFVGVVQARSPRLELFHLQPGDHRLEAVVLGEGGVFQTSNPVRIQVNLPLGAPRILVEPLDQEVDERSVARFSVVATADPPPTFLWFVDGVADPAGRGPVFQHPGIFNRELHISVMVSNSLGVARSREVLLIKGLAGELPGGIADSPRPDVWSPNGEVHAVAEADGVLFIGGAFDRLAPALGGAAVVDRIDAQPDPAFPQVEGLVKCAVADDQGGFFIGGSFSVVDGWPRTNLVHILADRSVDPAWQASADGDVLALVLVGNRLHVGGRFKTLNGQKRTGAAALTAATGALLPWVIDIRVVEEPTNFPIVYAMAADEDRVLLTGNFGVMAVDGENSTGPAWQTRFDIPPPLGGGIGYTLTLGPSTVFVGGRFDLIQNQTRGNLAAFDLQTGALLPWAPFADGAVTSMDFVCNAVVIAGDFNQVAGVVRPRLAALNPRRVVVLPWAPAVDGPIMALKSAFNIVYFSGDFTRVGTESRLRAAAVHYDSGAVLAWQPLIDGAAAAVAFSGRTVLLAAPPRGASAPRRNLAALDRRTGRPLPWNPDVDGPVRSIVVTNGVVFIGGEFSNVSGSAHGALAAIDAISGTTLPWNPGVKGAVRTLAVSPTSVFFGGDFTAVNGVARTNLAAVARSSGALLNWASSVFSRDRSPNGVATVHQLLLRPGELIAVGRFDEVNRQPRVDMASLDPDSGQLLSWDPVKHVDAPFKTLSSVRGITATETALWVVGDFLRSPTFGDWRGGLASFDLVTRVLTSWNPQLAVGSDLIYEGHTLAVLPDVVYVGGHFAAVFATPRRNLAAVDPAGDGEPLPWNPGADDTVNAVLAARDHVAVGGRFLAIGGRIRPHFALFAPRGAPEFVRQPVGGVIRVGSPIHLSAVVRGRAPIAFQWLFNGRPIVGATNDVLDILQASLSDNGIYQLMVSNRYGAVLSLDVVVTVVEPVRFISVPNSITLTPGGAPLVLRGQAVGVPAPIYQWRLNGVNIPGADQPSYTLPSVDPTNGGSYTLLAANPGGVVESPVALVVIQTPPLPFDDTFANAGTLAGSFGVGSGTNLNASREPGEPNIVNKMGGRSVWLRWIAPASGIATFSTTGSSFDTLLGIYTNSVVTALARVSEDEDRGGFAASTAAFNATGGTEYRIVVDGFAGAGGVIVLTWNLDTTTVPFPRIIVEPLSQAASPGEDVRFEVTVDSPTPVTYQWLFNCAELPGATNATLVVTNVQLRHVGVYAVQVRNASSQRVESLPVELELGADHAVVAQDKLEDLFTIGELGGPVLRFLPRLQGALPSSVGTIKISLGTNGSKTVNNSRAKTQPGETNSCGIIGGASIWFRLDIKTNGQVALDTIGSQIDTALAVYWLEDLSHLREVACDNDGAPDGVRSFARFAAAPGKIYLVGVDGVGGAGGNIRFHWQMGVTPHMAIQPERPTLMLGSPWTLRANTTGTVSTVSLQWLQNGRSILGATNSSWSLPRVRTTNAGIYSLVLSNAFGMTTNLVAELSLALPALVPEPALRNGTFQFWCPPENGERITLEVTTNLKRWTAVYTFTPTNRTAIIDFTPRSSQSRFFRLVVQ